MQVLLAAGPDNDDFGLVFDTDDRLHMYEWDGSFTWQKKSDQVFRDFSAWYHIVAVLDTANATAEDRARLYVNGQRIVNWNANTNPSLDFATTEINDTQQHRIGQTTATVNRYLNGYLADIHFIDGQALTPSSFTEVSATTGQLIPKAYTGTFTGNSFWLKFADNSAATATTLGKDSSGLGNNWTPNNLSVISGGPTSVAAASGALPIYNTTDTYGATKGTGTRTDSGASSINLALPMDGANNGTTFTDESATIRGSGSARSISRVGDAKTVTASSKFYGSSAYFDGSGDYLRITGLNSIGTGSHTVECWFYLEYIAGQRQYIFDTRSSGGGTGVYLIKHEGNGWYWTADGTSNNDNSVALSAIPINTWVHVAIVRNGTAGLLYVNGVLTATTSGNTGSLTSTEATVFAALDNTVPGKGYCQDFRMYSGFAKYTSNFNPPSSTQNPTIAAGNDSLVDTPTSYGTGNSGGDVRGNYATLNPLDKGSNITLTNGNLDVSCSSSWNTVRGTIGVSSGKWYWEYTMTAAGYTELGIGTSVVSLSTYPGSSASAYIYYSPNGNKGNSNSFSSYGNSYTTGDVIGVAIDLDSGKIWFAKNGTWQASGDPAAGTNAAYTSIPSATYFPIFGLDNTGGTVSGAVNAGARPFAYTAPSGFKALCDTNLPAPVVAKPSTVMDVKLYTGNGSTQTISGLGFSPDLVWTKRRDSASSHGWFDIVRGATKFLRSNGTDAEDTASDSLTSFNSAGFSLGADTVWGGVNQNGASYAAWCWDAGSSTVTNTQGSITSQVRANASAGFSVVTYTGTGANATIGHGGLVDLANGMIIIKNRASATNWRVYHGALGNTKTLFLSTTGTPDTNSVYWNNTLPTSTVYSVGSDDGVNGNGNAMVAFCFSPVSGYSSFGSYTGNGSADGPFVYTGFRPRWIMWKCTTAAYDWDVYDAVRDPRNAAAARLKPNSSDAEATLSPATFDILSNGFKLRADYNSSNASSQTFIYAAFAESPFQYARAR
jgi:hypothetical protein